MLEPYAIRIMAISPCLALIDMCSGVQPPLDYEYKACVSRRFFLPLATQSCQLRQVFHNVSRGLQYVNALHVLNTKQNTDPNI